MQPDPPPAQVLIVPLVSTLRTRPFQSSAM
jgi:hypothetical protein